jgi:hypothetical protein
MAQGATIASQTPLCRAPSSWRAQDRQAEFRLKSLGKSIRVILDFADRCMRARVQLPEAA